MLVSKAAAAAAPKISLHADDRAVGGCADDTLCLLAPDVTENPRAFYSRSGAPFKDKESRLGGRCPLRIHWLTMMQRGKAIEYQCPISSWRMKSTLTSSSPDAIGELWPVSTGVCNAANFDTNTRSAHALARGASYE